LWRNFNVYMRKKLSMCYYKHVKAFFGFRKYDSVNHVLRVLVLRSCDTIWHNANVAFNSRLISVGNSVVLNWAF